MNAFEIHFDRPIWLLLFLPALLVILLPAFHRGRGAQMSFRKTTALLHSAVAMLLVLVIAGVSITLPALPAAADDGAEEPEGEKQILMISDDPGKSGLLTAFLPQDHAVQTVSPDEAFLSSSALANVDEVILLGVSADSLPDGFQNVLSQYAQGGGQVLFTGSDHSLTLGGMKDTTYETLLPVTLDYERADGNGTALMLVLDCSNSMSGQRGYNTRSNKRNRYGGGDTSITNTADSLSMAKQGAIRSIESLGNGDEVGIISFNSYAYLEMPLSQANDLQKATAARVISSLSTAQGTYYCDALRMAWSALSASSAETRHVIFLSDGEPSDRGYDSLVRQMAADGITVSTIALGYSSSVLEGMAAEGRGRYYAVTGVSDLPEIMVEETEKVASDPLIEDETPVFLSGGLPSALPALNGYIGTTLKENAEMRLQTEGGDPVWATWKLGEGSVSVFTSNLGGTWCASWLNDDAAQWQLRQIFQPGNASPAPQETVIAAVDQVDPSVQTTHLLLLLLLAAVLLFLSELVCRRIRWHDLLLVFHRAYMPY